MIIATRNGDREVRLFEQSAAIPSYTGWLGSVAPSGVLVTTETALGLPTVGAAVRLIAETVASLPLCTYRGLDADKRPATTSTGWRLLHDQPNPDQSAFDLVSDIAASVETWGNAYIRKLKSRRGLLAMYVLDPSAVRVKRDEGNRKVFEVTTAGRRVELTDVDVLHVRGFTPRGGDVGLSPIQQHREAIGSALALQRFQGRFFTNDATPSLYMTVPGDLDETQAERLRARFEARHGGVENAGSIAILGNGAELSSLSMPLRDAQFIEGHQEAAAVAARIFLGPAASLLGADANQKTEEESLRFVNFCLLPRLRRIERALLTDPDLYPPDSGEYPQFDIDEFLRADAATRAEVNHKYIQSGVLLVDEVRAEMGRQPLPDGAGQVPQITPVGGAPNSAAAATSPPEE